MNQPTPPIPAHQPPCPFETSMESWTTGDPDDWPNTVTISVVTAWSGAEQDDIDPTVTEADAAAGYADLGGERELVQLDTNYKATRPGQHPVRLTRADAARLTAHVLAAVEDTFHYTRRGRLRATEAAELLHALAEVDAALANLREHALDDLLQDTGIAD